MGASPENQAQKLKKVPRDLFYHARQLYLAASGFFGSANLAPEALAM